MILHVLFVVLKKAFVDLCGIYSNFAFAQGLSVVVLVACYLQHLGEVG